jgi:O-antigen/teichoic acid export membrane protein
MAPWIADKAIAAPHLTGMLRLSSLCVLLATVSGAQISALAGFEAFKATALISFVTGVCQSVFSLAGCWIAGLSGLIVAVTAGYGVAVLVTQVMLASQMRRYAIRLHWKASFTDWPILFRFSVPAFLSSAMVLPVLWLCNAMLAHQPNGYAELGTFNAANQWYTAILIVPSAIGTAVLPVLSERYAAGDTAGSGPILNNMMRLAALIVVPLVVALCLFSKLIMSGYGSSFADGYLTLVYSVITAGLLAVMAPLGQFLAASGRMWTGFWMNLGWAIVLLASSWLMVRWGAEGLAGSRLVAYAIHGVWVLGYVFYMTKSAKCNAMCGTPVGDAEAPATLLRRAEA